MSSFARQRLSSRLTSQSFMFSRREWLTLGAAALTCRSTKLRAASTSKYITPEQFGAKGDGVTNDTAAFADMTSFVNRRGGGAIALRATTYIVGKQAADPAVPAYYPPPAPIMNFKGCTKQLAILGNGGRLSCASGLKFGTFDPSTGLPAIHPQPYYGQGELASPYTAMISVQNCTGGIDISNLELDGNLAALIIGGPWGDTGWQIPGDGINLINNTCSEQVTNVISHHHVRDGIMIIGAAERNAASAIEGCLWEYNTRQGCSLVAGKNYSFSNCKFNHTGRAGLSSAPTAGIDIEAETAPIRNVSFSACEFSDNKGVGLLADAGDIAGVTADACRLIGTTAWAAWPQKPLFRFTNCEFIGSIVNAYGDDDPTRAAQFTNCSFVDDPALSPTGQIYRSQGLIADLAYYKNVLFDACRFELEHGSVLPWSVNVIYNNCAMSQISTKTAYPRGTYTGVNQIEGPVVLYGSIIEGDLTVNGEAIARTA